MGRRGGLPAEIQPPSTTGIGGAITVCKGELKGQLTMLQGGQWPLMLTRVAWGWRTRRRGRSLMLGWTATGIDAGGQDQQHRPAGQLYIHGEDEQPFPSHRKLTRNTLIVNFVEKGNRVAFTGTIVDGVIRTVLEAVDDTLGAITYRSW
ncbi:hypothetical protein GS485_17415 [Rhodococcus hoagii]|nr:hypothetical protein [Prescottella equi]